MPPGRPTNKFSKFNKKGSKKGDKKKEGEGKEDTEKTKIEARRKQRRFAINPKDIKNKELRTRAYALQKNEKKKLKKEGVLARKKEREALGDAAPKPFMKSLDKMREPEPSIVEPGDEEMAEDQEKDEFASYFDGTAPKVAITTNVRASRDCKRFVCHMMDLIPNVTYYRRREFPIKKIIKFLKNRDFTDLIVVGETRKTVDTMMIIHLPEGPTATFKISNIQYPEDIPDAGPITNHDPELILNNFTTRMGYGVGRMIAALFPQVPDFSGRRVITFHNQRDFIFVRQHRYIFDRDPFDKEVGLKPRIQELGPRMTLKLQRIQHGTFDTMEGEFEWFGHNRLYKSSKKFYL
jgi:ribosome production factor 1